MFNASSLSSNASSLCLNASSLCLNASSLCPNASSLFPYPPPHSQQDIVQCAKQLELTEQDFQAKMAALKATVQSKTAVPTSQVYVS